MYGRWSSDEADALAASAFEHDVLFCHSMASERKQVGGRERARWRAIAGDDEPQRVAMCSQTTAAPGRATASSIVDVRVASRSQPTTWRSPRVRAEEPRPSRRHAFHQAVVCCRSASGAARGRRLTAELRSRRVHRRDAPRRRGWTRWTRRGFAARGSCPPASGGGRRERGDVGLPHAPLSS